ncbi:5'-3' exonuclease H3TH domain-containing protein [Conexibacter sp. JD483]|uniref:5'-3' exonuclease n=1 Tax=unclassified Conexibacter TaxID=2627773 RepID=UPI0027178730|nr:MULTISPECIES: 5'-3' exonuclease H3TH domain-containing protein [unclassified Conexibacter]MDO8184352.1 5'-3' exonuclease H3TH domain-containing protein [Conexibacter sp. CPCC 205706]MDO8197658.1 5'-3' exonuclease H3TH domain-containing protein [Conexibacter sp. CPCC 205762]MDR9368321.1 5'-3' exonuclease H3TH domain-containing protein [Conexibacter sp. JD483]
MPSPLLAVDAPSLLYRAWFALPDSIKGDGGMPVNALLGATNAILRIVADHGPRAVVICNGAEAARYRVARYAGYHADRPPVPEGLALQFARSGELFEGFGWTLAGSDELEADDLLHSFALTETEAGGRALLMTGDRDMFQCATDAVTVLYLKTGVRGFEPMTPAAVEQRYGIPPALVPDFIALRGDPSDGLPGARGIGEKGAADLLRRHGSLEAALADPDGERPRVARALREQAEELRDYLAIATLQRVEVARPADASLDLAGGADAAEALGMRRLAVRLRAADRDASRL